MDENKQEHFIKNIEIKNFKCFEDFKAEGFGRVNLIGGKNNVGKTAFMEALELYLTSTDTFSLAFSLHNLIRRRQSANRRERYFELDFMYKNSSKLELRVNDRIILIEYYDELDNGGDFLDEHDSDLSYEPSLKLSINENEKTFPINRIVDRPPMMRKPSGLKNDLTINFISSTTMEEREIATLYGALVDLNKEDFLNKSLQLFDNNIIALKQKATGRDIVLKLSLKDQELPVLLSSLGEGINRYIAILCAIWASKDGVLFIDEIENGIHYSNYDKLWELVLKVSEEARCQLFISTHSLECIKSYLKTAKKLQDKNITYTKMTKLDDGSIIAGVRDYDMLQYALEDGHEVRG